MLFWLLQRYLRLHARAVSQSILNPREAQVRALARLQGVFGASGMAVLSGFTHCRKLEDCRRLPPSDEESMRPHFESAYREGVRGSAFFGRTPIRAFGRTSGTSGTPKDIPLNREYFASLDRTLVRMMASYHSAVEGGPSLLAGRQILLGSRPLIETSPTGLPVADISGLLPTRTWRSLRRLYLPRHRDLWLGSWPSRAEATLEQARGQDVVSISGIPALAEDFARRAREKFGVTYLTDLWPNLRRYVYGALHLDESQRRRISKSWLGDENHLNFLETYFATEGALAFSHDPRQEGLALNLLENLYLFRESAGSPFLLAHELEPKRAYSLFITTPGGLIQYCMQDRIEAVSARPLLIRVVGREKEEISMTGEKISLEQLDLALKACGVDFDGFKGHWPIVWVERGERPHLVWGVPASELPDGRRLDDALCRLNHLYAEALIHEEVIERSRVVSIPSRVYDEYLSRRIGIGQVKPRRIFNSTRGLDDVYGWSPTLAGSAESSD